MRPIAALTAAISVLVLASSASAAPVSYTMQTGGRSQKDIIALDGDQLTKFQTSAAATSCPDGHTPSSDDSFDIALPGPVTLSDGNFQFSGRAKPSYYPGDDPSQGADYTVTGSVTPDGQVITGTVSISNANDPFISGCSGGFDFIAIPSVTTPSGGPAKTDFQSQFVSFNYRDGVVQRLRLQANFDCGPSVDSATVVAKSYGLDGIHADKTGVWTLHSFVFDEYNNIIELKVTGRISGRVAKGRITVSEPKGLTGVAGDECSGNYAWSAARPRPPAPPGPQAFFDWDAVRIDAGTDYRYYFLVSGVSCTNGATAIRFVVSGQQHTVACRDGQGWASGPVPPGRNYTAKATAIVVRHGRVVKHGTSLTETIHMPAPGDRWIRINSLPPPPA